MTCGDRFARHCVHLGHFGNDLRPHPCRVQNQGCNCCYHLETTYSGHNSVLAFNPWNLWTVLMFDSQVCMLQSGNLHVDRVNRPPSMNSNPFRSDEQTKKYKQPRGCCGPTVLCQMTAAAGRRQPKGCCQKARTRAHRLTDMHNSKTKPNLKFSLLNLDDSLLNLEIYGQQISCIGFHLQTHIQRWLRVSVVPRVSGKVSPGSWGPRISEK